MIQNPRPKIARRTPQEIAVVRIGSALEQRSQARRRLAGIAVAGACAALCLASLAIHQGGASRDYEQGSAAADSAASAAAAILSMRDPVRGYARIDGQVFESSIDWGAAQRSSAIPDGSGAQVEIAFSSRMQCLAALRSAQARFELAFVDAKPALDPEQACKELGQNTLRWVKLDPREKAARERTALSAGSFDPVHGGFIPARAKPGPRPPSGPPAAPTRAP